MNINRIAGALGAELSGLDLRKPLTESAAAEVRKAFLAHKVIFVRNQPLDCGQFLQFARTFGQPVEYPFVKGIEGHPEIIEVKKLEHEKVNFGGVWHSDTTYLEVPPMGTMLLSKEIPPYGGDTLFASQVAAYEALSDTMKRLLDGLVGIASSAKADVSRTREDRLKSDGNETAAKEYVAKHPVVRKPARRRSTSTSRTPSASKDSPKRKARRCCSSCSSTRSNRNSPAAGVGNRTASPSGTTAPCSTTRSTTTTASAGCCSGSRWLAHGQPERGNEGR
jgi:alpha-ketoglutarate-dependent taurine dioxygenase